MVTTVPGIMASRAAKFRRCAARVFGRCFGLVTATQGQDNGVTPRVRIVADHALIVRVSSQYQQQVWAADTLVRQTAAGVCASCSLSDTCSHS